MAKHFTLYVILAVFVASLHAQGSRELCENGKGKFDIILSTPNNEVYIIKGERVWRLIGDKDSGFNLAGDGFPKAVSEVWPGLPTGLNTAYTDYSTRLTYFFKADKVWVYRDQRLQPGYPKPVTSEFRNLPNGIDGAFMCTGYNYFFKGNQVYSGRSGNPGPNINSKWPGLPNNMHASVQFPSRGHTFFFKDHQFYKYRVWNGPVEAGYPKDVVPFWFQCEEPVTKVPVTKVPDYDEGPQGENEQDFP